MRAELEALVEKWRQPRYKTKDGYTLEHDHDFQYGREMCADELSAILSREKEQARLLAIGHCPWDVEQEDEGDPLPEPHCHAGKDGDCTFAYCPQPLLRVSREKEPPE